MFLSGRESAVSTTLLYQIDRVSCSLHGPWSSGRFLGLCSIGSDCIWNLAFVFLKRNDRMVTQMNFIPVIMLGAVLLRLRTCRTCVGY
jgi:hypothetical protein